MANEVKRLPPKALATYLQMKLQLNTYLQGVFDGMGITEGQISINDAGEIISMENKQDGNPN